jgi:hypothetical protein
MGFLLFARDLFKLPDASADRLLIARPTKAVKRLLSRISELCSETPVGQHDANQRSQGRSSSSQKMQYAAQIDGIWRDLFQSLEKNRDATSSSTVQAGAEMSPKFAYSVT